MKEWKTKTGIAIKMVVDNNRRLYIGKPLYEFGHPKHCLYFDTREDLSRITEEEGHCHECLTHMEGQLYQLLDNPEAGKRSIDLGRAYDCWRVFAELSSYFPREVLGILRENTCRISHEKIPNESLFGKVGSNGLEGSQFIILYPHNLKEALQIEKEIDRVFRDHRGQNGYRGCRIDNGCSDILEPLVGPSDTWDERKTPIINPEKMGDAFVAINSCLYD